MSRAVKRSASQAVKAGRCSSSALHPSAPFPASRGLRRGLNGCTKSNFGGFLMAACIEDGQVQLLTGTCLDWTDKYPSRHRDACEPNVKTSTANYAASTKSGYRASLTHKRRPTATRCAPAIMPLGGARPQRAESI
jgi:hypothetical protein